jgi:hypothetical protein
VGGQRADREGVREPRGGRRAGSGDVKEHHKSGGVG